ncbi:gliding motility-associated C-terminal domain-containing protein [Flavobacterium sp. RHBU_24]|uniref:T9SS type B sorting domain-containing protein n=1 Tax=Flavobacterium sp. RHBU_24 TaxID=3391185 RepID=UPI0039849CE0
MMQKNNTRQEFTLSLIVVFFLSFISAYAQPPCVSTAIGSISPITGPSGTVVTLTGIGFNIGAGTTSVKFNGVEAAAFTVVSNTQITAVAPATGTNGIVTIITNGCQASGPVFTYLQNDCSNNEPEIYISELYDHTPGSYGVIELYNPSPTNTITFNGEYVLERYGDVNGSLSYTLTLSGSIGPEETYLVLSYGTGEMGCSVVTNASMGSGINDNDQFLLKKNGAVIDEARAPGDIGYSVIRKPNAIAPNVSYSASDWNFFNTQSCADLGSHNAAPTPPAVTITAQPQDDVACLGENATFTVGLSNTTGVTYQWKTLVAGIWVNVSGGNYSGANSATLTVTGATLLQNNTQYYCEVTVSPACTLLTEAVQLTVTPLPTATFTIVQPTCLLPTGIITLIPGAGLTLTYSLNGGPFVSNPVFSTLNPGTYNVTIKTDGGCTATLSIVVNDPPGTPDVAETAVIHPTCATPTGTITVTSPLGAEYTYTLLPGGTAQSSSVFSGLAPGNYTVTVTNALGCTSVTPTIVINPAPAAPEVATTIVTQPDCTTPTGTITISGMITIGYGYSINGGPFQPETVFSGLIPGTYTITTINAAGCTSVTPVITINPAPGAPAIAITTVTQPDCNTPTGSITITPTTEPGVGTNYSINGGPFGPDLTYPNLTAGSYTITVQNAAGCTSVTPPIIINAAPLPVPAITTTVVQPDCTNPVATITVTAPVGTGYQYSINGGTLQDSPVFSTTVAGDYTITVQNADGCMATTAPITIADVPNAPALATTDIIHPDCTVTTGTITVTGPVEAAYLYSIDGGTFQAGTVFTGVAPGDHTITVQNIAGCTSIVTVTVNPVPTAPAVATVIATDPSCSSTLGGTITVTSPLGGAYTYSIDGGNTYVTTPVFTGLEGGLYTITVQSTVGCTSVTAPITINAGPSAPDAATTILVQPDCDIPSGSITITAPLGAGYTYSLNNGPFVTNTTFDGLAAGNYTITVQNSGGCTADTGPLTINAAPPVPPVPVTTQTHPDCSNAFGSITVTAPLGNYKYSINNGFYQDAPEFLNLVPGDYTIRVQSASGGCTTVTGVITINPAPVNPAVANTVQTQPDCSTGVGSITVTAPLGSEYSYSINGGAYQTSPVFGNLSTGTYNVTVQTTGGCTSTTADIAINTPSDLPQLTGTQGCEPTINGRNYLLTGFPVDDSFDPSQVTYEWRVLGSPVVIGDEATLNVTQYALSNLNLEFPVTFELTVTTTGGCEALLNFTVDGIFCDIPRGISPNNDTMNDNFDLTGLNVRNLKIFNRYGLEVYSKPGYSNEWFGQTNGGDELPTGSYFYVIDLADTTKTGWVYINRQTN